ncbi:hypothetical protein Bbelb_408690 [Branchiostoma belcheri]|nr:hypothetical protein Bbelb_408690 [Branchiostoma belcheri]
MRIYIRGLGDLCGDTAEYKSGVGRENSQLYTRQADVITGSVPILRAPATSILFGKMYGCDWPHGPLAIERDATPHTTQNTHLCRHREPLSRLDRMSMEKERLNRPSVISNS